jgi:hypothetical protein
MWTCPICKRTFAKAKQPHSCRKIPINEHFKNKPKAKQLFDFLVTQIHDNVGECKIVSLPCCIHLYGKYDFLTALPKKDKLEIRFALGRKLDSPTLIQFVPVSAMMYKNCFAVRSEKEIDKQFIGWIKESYQLKVT